MNAPDLVPHLEPQFRVEVRERLVHQDQRRIDHDRARERHALLLAAGELARQLLRVRAELHQVERGIDALARFVSRHAPHLQAEADIRAHAHMREERVVLEHHAEAALLGLEHVDPALVEPDAAARERQQPGQAIERRRLAAAGGAEQGHELTAADRQRELVKRGGLVEAARDSVEPQFLEAAVARGTRLAARPLSRRLVHDGGATA